ncbi:aminoglycoside phosphotransferase family protein [Planctomonas sp. JC2975]|uniref:phosphotransferase n=1 Tax=Planctomonas sp. JC2975 TaxID=2729626 RepID=UPI001472784F|nr:aminoglycoside phosphotransferase family protein [Planctomonas sp. JC2975]NNC10473.1 aminoglycoside phosphotransferase family protein [Planctomonas sp. JC2975]
MDEEVLEGGRTTPGVVRIGDAVHRPRDHRSDFAARALQFLNTVGYPWAPRCLGIDDAGRDVFSYVEGATTEHPLQRDERSYAQMGRMLRRLHELTAGTEIALGGRCLVHGDPGPFNVVMVEGMPAALIDWDSVHPGDPMHDVGYAGWSWCITTSGNVPVSDQARRLAEFRDGYDITMPSQALLAAVEERQAAIIDAESRHAADPRLSDARRAHARAAVAWARGDRAIVAANLGVFLEHLG